MSHTGTRSTGSRRQARRKRSLGAEDGRVIGYATFYWAPEDRIGEVGNNAVLPAFRGRGIGLALIAETIRIMREWGAEILRVTTFEHDHPARRIYEKLGFREIARSIHFTMRASEAQP